MLKMRVLAASQANLHSLAGWDAWGLAGGAPAGRKVLGSGAEPER